eukprot:SM000015S01273  [mRNA]  locus=s15:967909:985221:- [translate_table: standard]
MASADRKSTRLNSSHTLQSRLAELAALDARFGGHREPLFGAAALREDRELLDAPANARLDAVLAAFLRLLSAYLLLPAAHQTLEYLIRRYKVQVYNVDAMMACILPYHETNLFVKIVQLLHLRKTRWEFLEGCQRSGAAVPRSALVQRCTHDMAVLEAICELAKSAAELGALNRVALSFCAVTVMETMAVVPVLSDSLVNRILPYVQHSFRKDVAKEYQAGGLMVVAQIASRAELSEALLETLFEGLCKPADAAHEAAGPPMAEERLLLLVQLCQKQMLNTFPRKAFNYLVKFRDLPILLAEVSARFNTFKLLSLLLEGLIQHRQDTGLLQGLRGLYLFRCLCHFCALSSKQERHEQLLLNIIARVPLSRHVKAMVLSLLSICQLRLSSNKDHGEELQHTRSMAHRVLQALDKRYGAELDEALNVALADANEDRSSKKSVEEGASGLLSFLNEALPHSLRSPLPESRTTLLRAVNDAKVQFLQQLRLALKAHIRVAAVRRLAELSRTSEMDLQFRIYVVDVLQQRLQDEDWQVTLAVLAAKDMLINSLSPESLFNALAGLLHSARRAISSASKGQQADIRAVLKRGLKLLVNDFLPTNASYARRVATTLTCHLLCTPKLRSVSHTAIRLAAQLGEAVPEFQCMQAAEAAMDQHAAGEDSEKHNKEEGQRRDTLVNTAVVSSIAESGLAAVVDALGESSGNLDTLVLLLALLKLGPDIDQESLYGYLDKLLSQLKRLWEMLGESDLPMEALQKIAYLDTDNNSADVLIQRFATSEGQSSASTQAEFLLRSLHMLLRRLLGSATSELSMQGSEPSHRRFVKELYVLFVTAKPTALFEKHLTALLDHVAASSTLIQFLVDFIVGDESVSEVVQVRSLQLLASHFGAAGSTAKPTALRDMAVAALPALLITLGGHSRPAREEAQQCVTHIYSATSTMKKQVSGAKVPWQACWRLLKELLDARDLFAEDGGYLSAFLDDMLNAKNGRLGSESSSILDFLIHEALAMPLSAQIVMMSSVAGVGHNLLLARATRARLSTLLQSCRDSSAAVHANQLSDEELNLLDQLLMMYSPDVLTADEDMLQPLLLALHSEGATSHSTRLRQAALRQITAEGFESLSSSGQEKVFQALIVLKASNTDQSLEPLIQNALDSLQLDGNFLARQLDSLVELFRDEQVKPTPGKRQKGKSKKEGRPAEWSSLYQNQSGREVRAMSALLEYMLHKSIPSREGLTASLQRLLKLILDKEWPSQAAASDATLAKASPSATERDQARPMALSHIQMLIVLNLEDMASRAADQDAEEFDVGLTLRFVRATDDTAMQSQGILLVTALAKLKPEAVLEHVLALIQSLGQSTLSQDDSHSHQVVRNMLLTILPLWLERKGDIKSLFQTFVDILPGVPTHRKLLLVTSALRAVGEKRGLPIILLLLLRAAEVTPKGKISVQEMREAAPENANEATEQWAEDFATQLCEQFTRDIQLSAFVDLLSSRELQPVLMDFIAARLASRAFVGTITADAAADTPEDAAVQSGYVAMMEQVIVQLGSPQTGKKVAARDTEREYVLLGTLFNLMAPKAYLQGVTALLGNTDTRVQQKVLKLFTARLNAERTGQPLSRQERKHLRRAEGNTAARADAAKDEAQHYADMASELAKLLAVPLGASGDTALRQAALQAMDGLARKYAKDAPGQFAAALPAVLESMGNPSKAVVVAALQVVASVVSALSSKVLVHLPRAVPAVLAAADQALAALRVKAEGKEAEEPAWRKDMLVEALTCLEAMIQELGAFLSPYLKQVLTLLISSVTISGVTASKAQAIGHLIAEKVPARLLLDPLDAVYEEAVAQGPGPVQLLLGIVEALVHRMDKLAVSQYHNRISAYLLQALSLRETMLPPSDVGAVEKASIDAFAALVMKLSENTFRPLFIRMLEWSQSKSWSQSEDGAVAEVESSLNRSIAFYGLVNVLAEKLRQVMGCLRLRSLNCHVLSVFVPYFGYLQDRAIALLTGGGQAESVHSLSGKRKKRRSSSKGAAAGPLSEDVWHLRYLVISSLHKCFLYDSVAFVDPARFEVFLPAIVAQILVEPPPAALAGAEEGSIEGEGAGRLIPSITEVDDTLVSCLSQLALAAGSDVQWKALNYQVLMCSRDDKRRSKLLAVRAVLLLVEKLKEEYLVLVPETIPFLAELLEESDLEVVTATQELVRSLESFSGEDLSQYF